MAPDQTPRPRRWIAGLIAEVAACEVILPWEWRRRHAVAAKLQR